MFLLANKVSVSLGHIVACIFNILQKFLCRFIILLVYIWYWNFFSFTEHAFDCQRQAFKLSELFIRSEDNQTTMPLYWHHKPKDRDPKDSKSGLIYSYQCPQLDCNEEYIGETGRTLGERREEHLKQPSPIGILKPQDTPQTITSSTS